MLHPRAEITALLYQIDPERALTGSIARRLLKLSELGLPGNYKQPCAAHWFQSFWHQLEL